MSTIGQETAPGELVDKVINVRRCAAVIKGGRRFSFTAMVVVGNRQGRVGWGYGKANEVPPAYDKAIKSGTRNMIEIPLVRPTPTSTTIPHPVWGIYGSSKVLLLPASPGTGIIAGGVVRAVCEVAGISDILTKSFGSNNPQNLAKATIAGLAQLRSKEEVERLRGVRLS